MIVAVLETHVLVSAFPAQGAVPATLIDAWRQGAYHLVVSEPILEDLSETWRDPYWEARFSPTDSAAAITLLRTAAIVTPLTIAVTGVATHPEDDLILATAVASGAAYLVTGDRKLRAVGTFQGIAMLTPRAFLEILSTSTWMSGGAALLRRGQAQRGLPGRRAMHLQASPLQPGWPSGLQVRMTTYLDRRAGE